MSIDATIIESGPEWAVACEVQKRFLPALAPSSAGVDYSAHCRQVHELGGDSYDCIPLGGSLGLMVADASGKGLAAALMISNVQSSLRMAASFTGTDPAATLAVVNRHVHTSSLADRYATLFYGVLDPATRTLRYVNAGHNPPMLMRPDGSVVWLETGGAPVGMFPDWTYEEAAVQLGGGDVLLAYTDGIVESVNPAGEEWGVESLRNAARDAGSRGAPEMVRAIFRSLDEFTGARQTDDATVLVLRVR